MPNLEWNVDYHTQQIATIINANKAILSKPVGAVTYNDTYLLLHDMRRIKAHTALLIGALQEHQQSTPKSKFSKILAILRS